MNKKLPLLLLTAIALTSCAKTEDLYRENEYNSPVFDENYYTDWKGIDKINATDVGGAYSNLDYSIQEEKSEVKIGGVTQTNSDGKAYKWGYDKENQFGYNNNLSKIEKKFNYGMTSKLFDGRVRCERLYQKSRVQVDKSGFAMYFPKALKQAKYLAFACRGGTDYSSPADAFSYSNLKINVEWSFYIHIDSSTYSKVTYKLNQIEVPVDNGGNTVFVSFTPSYLRDTFDELYDATAMSFKWEYADTKIEEEIAKGDLRHVDLVDDYTQKNKHHLALMLYEVFIGDSIWG